MGHWTIKMLRKVDPETRLNVAAYLFWISLILGALSVVLLAKNSYEKVLMGISWGAINITCIDVILTADVRAEES